MIKEFEIDGEIYRLYAKKNGIEVVRMIWTDRAYIGFFSNVRSALRWCYEYSETKKNLDI